MVQVPVIVEEWNVEPLTHVLPVVMVQILAVLSIKTVKQIPLALV